MLLRQFVGLVEQTRQFIADRDLTVLTGDFRQLVERFAELLFQHRQIDAGLAQHRQAVAALLVNQGQQQVSRFNQAVIAADGQTLGIAQGLLEFTGEFIDTHVVPLIKDCAPRRLPMKLGCRRRSSRPPFSLDWAHNFASSAFGSLNAGSSFSAL